MIWDICWNSIRWSYRKDYQVRFGKNMTFQVETRAPHLPAEWALQSGVQLTWPHANTDWAYMLEEVQQCFIAIASEIAKRELLLIVTPEPEEVRMQISAAVNMDNVRFWNVKRMILGRATMELSLW